MRNCRQEEAGHQTRKKTLNSPRHPLNKPFTKMVESYGHLHCLISGVRVTVA